jgi:hypothetical protein
MSEKHVGKFSGETGLIGDRIFLAIPGPDLEVFEPVYRPETLVTDLCRDHILKKNKGKPARNEWRLKKP